MPDETRFSVREWTRTDDLALTALMHGQSRIDPGWPPDYARHGDLAEWLAKPADLGRWVAVNAAGMPVGHVGLGTLRAGSVADFLCTALRCDADCMAEICRIVVDPSVRGQGLSGLLTRKALRASIERGLIPVSTVLRNRGSWLAMMLATGWRDVGTATAPGSGQDLIALIPPQRFIDAALDARRARADR